MTFTAACTLLAVLWASAVVIAAPSAYCTGQRITDEPGALIHPNGSRVVTGALDLRQVRYEFPAPGAVITVGADLTTGRLDRASIGAVCVSGR